MPQTPYIYKHKPPLNTIEDLLSFLEPIPPRYWCVDLQNGNNHTHCVLGHLNEVYKSLNYQPAIQKIKNLTKKSTTLELARINNGEVDECNSGNRYPKADLSGKGAKSRVIRFLRGLLKK